jgi:glutaminyl-tRNA synthetase
MATERNDFIRDIIDADLAAGRHQRVATRFPPEPNGYLHIGHAKSICLNFGIARDYQGICNLRYDDTNPAKEETEYVESIERDVRWLGFEPSAVLFSADYFPKMYELAERLVVEGNAYVCDLTYDERKEGRGTLSVPGKPSPYRDRAPAESLDLLRRMKAGEFPDRARTLRAKIDMASPNMKMRDPLLYRILHAHHHRSGDAWCIYPMYDYAHPIEDAIEGITHSICTLEFENNRELYDWVLDNTGPWNPRPRQYEFARLALDYTVMSKRKLLELVKDKHVAGWDDPRMPTISGMRRRGYSPEALRAFADMIGVAKANSMVDIGKLEYCVRDDLNRNAPRVLGVLRPVEVTLTNVPQVVNGILATVDAPLFPADIGKPGTRKLEIGERVYIDRNDWRDADEPGYQRLAPGKTVRLRYGYCITAEGADHDASGAVTRIRAKVHPETLGGTNPSDGSKVSGVIHWVDAATSIVAEVRLYEHLFRSAKPEEGGANFLDQLDPKSLETIGDARIEASMASAEVGSRWQLERVGYFSVDSDTRPGALVLNRIVTLRDSSEKRTESQPTPPSRPSSPRPPARPPRPKGKSPAEYRAEARARDPELAAAHEKVGALVSADSADLLAGDRVTAQLFLDTVALVGFAETTAKWMINELPRALGDRELAEANLDAPRFAELIKLLGESKLPAASAKTALAEMIATGKKVGEVATQAPAISAADLDARIQEVIAANPEKAAQYKAGRAGLLGFFVGQVIKAAPGADPTEVNTLVRSRLG